MAEKGYSVGFDGGGVWDKLISCCHYWFFIIIIIIFISFLRVGLGLGHSYNFDVLILG